MVHARLGIAEENSGKLVTLVRNKAKEQAERNNLNTIIIDGSPGIGCPVIASITGVDLVVAVTEPTLSGSHDLGRVIELAGHFSTPLGVVINKWNLNEDMTRTIENLVASKDIEMFGKIRYDRAVTEAMVHETSVVEYTRSPVTEDVREVWKNISGRLEMLPD